MTEDQIKQALFSANSWVETNGGDLVHQALILRDTQLAVALEALEPFVKAWEPSIDRLPKGAAIYHRTDTDPDKNITVLATALSDAKSAAAKIKEMETR